LIFIAGTIGGAQAQTYPSRPITLIAPTSPGGRGHHRAHSDRTHEGDARPAGHRRERDGAGGSIGVTRVARSAPDGYTVSIGHLNTHVFTGRSTIFRSIC